MKKYIVILIIAILTVPLTVNAQRRSGDKSSQSKTTVRTSKSTSVKKPSVTKKRSTTVQRKAPVTRPSRNNTRTENKSVTRSPVSKQVRSTVRQNTDRQPANRTPVNKPRINTPERRSQPQGSEIRRNQGDRRYIPGRKEVYRSTRKFIHERPVRHHYRFAPHSRIYRARHFPYRRPVYIDLYWSVNVYHHWCTLYPVVEHWGYYNDYTINTISAYDAIFYIGEIQRIYGKVSEVFYAEETDEYFLYMGAYFPYHDFTVVIPGDLARRFSRHPEFYFEDEHVVVTGLITEFDEKPEIVVREKSQLKRY